jgi:probable HAF family extracellular repeat protein
MPVRLSISLLFLLALFAIPPAAAGEPRYTVKVIGGVGSAALDVNRSGQVVGVFNSGGADHAFLYTSALVDLGTLGGASSGAAAINDAGRVVGFADTGDNLAHAFLFRDGAMHDLGTLGGLYSHAAGINGAGTIVGGASTADTFDGVLPRAYVFAAGSMSSIGTFPNGDASVASAINSAGHVVGQSAISTDDPPEHPYHAFLYADGAMVDLGTLGGLFSRANSINDGGAVVGEASTGALWPSGHFVPHAFLFAGGRMQDLGAFGGEFAASQANDINTLGQVVGASEADSGDRRGFLFECGKMLDLNALIDPASGWVVRSAQAINDLQQIAATACRGDDCFAVRLDLISAVPEPATTLMLLAGLALLGCWRRRA